MPAGLTLALHAIGAIISGVWGGGVISAALSWHGLCLINPAESLSILVRLTTMPTNPAAAWPSDPRPGPAWLTWLSIVLAAIVWCSIVGILSGVLDGRNRRHDGIATVTDLRRSGLDAGTAIRKAGHEYPKLVARSRRRSRR
ncbi:hypothetical protein [Nocardia panacis]|uniref:hypothetical protein n=1 Tax=Nocardia panacis TaxID=2340916 RepID=UPI0011C3ADBB|nr:hypothetical protein [Nocardia panacis]